MIDYKKYRLPGAVAVLALIIALVVASRGEFGAKPPLPPPLAEETAVPAVNMDKSPGILRAGTVEKPFALPVTSGYSGRISEMYVADGEAVKAGQPLYKMEQPPAAGGYSYEQARKDYERLQKLYEKGAVPRRQVEVAAANLQTVQQRGNSGGSTTITAPVDGIVADLAAAAGGAVQAGQQVLALGGGQKVTVAVPLHQNELNSVPLGAPVDIEAAGKIVKGRVTGIYPEARENKVPFFQAHIKLIDPPQGLLKEGMSVNVRIDTGT
ncbi:MAG TPA: efflux RND transporter periplasmic adaptor subunit [Negativicutes bacterium]|nr:efflux RND transporter periplasmic adaptor subunit [Negativicutes bacterium]